MFLAKVAVLFSAETFVVKFATFAKHKTIIGFTNDAFGYNNYDKRL